MYTFRFFYTGLLKQKRRSYQATRMILKVRGDRAIVFTVLWPAVVPQQTISDAIRLLFD